MDQPPRRPRYLLRLLGETGEPITPFCVRDAIRDVLDLNLFAQEQRRESEDARLLMASRKQVQGLL
jgi:hypothetical protein